MERNLGRIKVNVLLIHQGGSNTTIDYLMICELHRTMIQNTKVIQEAAVTQHHLKVIDTRMKGMAKKVLCQIYMHES